MPSAPSPSSRGQWTRNPASSVARGARSGRARSVRSARSAVKGAVAGALATAAMDTLLYVRYRRSGGTEGPFRVGVLGECPRLGGRGQRQDWWVSA